MTKVDFHASSTHTFDHLAPIWTALIPVERGTFTVMSPIRGHAARSGVRVRVGVPDGSNSLVVLGSWGDVRLCRGRPFVMVEHGAGQSYQPAPSSDTTPDECLCGLVGMLVPNEQTAARNRLHHPHAQVTVTGSAKLERWFALRETRNEDLGSRMPVVAFAWHWASPLHPCARTAFSHWSKVIAELAAVPDDVRGFRMVGHGHPRTASSLRRFYASVGVPWWTAEQVITDADLCVFDNTSFGFECAAVGMPVVVLDAPWYQTRGEEWGLRFWECADVGVRIGSGTCSELRDAIVRTLTDDPQRDRRAEVVAQVYPIIDGATVASVAAVRVL